jgi:inner membrane protein
MDNLTHTLVGLAAAKAGLERASPYATAVCLVAANAPDADILAAAGGGWFYLQHHRGITHSVVGTLALALFVPLLFYAAERLLARWRGFAPKIRLRGLVLASVAAGATHPLLDWTNNYGLRPFLPWSGKWYYGDLVFILDPWLWLALGGACFLATARPGWRVYAWGLLAVVLTAAAVFIPARSGVPGSTFLRFAFPLCVVLFAAAYRLRPRERWGRAMPAAALVFVVAYWGALAVLHARALDRATRGAAELARQRGETPLKVAAMPTLADPTRWVVIFETERATHRYQLSLREPPNVAAPGDWQRFEKLPDEPAAWLDRAAREDYAARVFLGFARFPVAKVWGVCPGEARLQLADLRFTEPGAARRAGSFALELPVRCRP